MELVATNKRARAAQQESVSIREKEIRNGVFSSVLNAPPIINAYFGNADGLVMELSTGETKELIYQ